MKPTQTLRALVRLTTLLAGLFVFAGQAPAQTAATGTIEGRVLNTDNGKYLNNVRVTVRGYFA
jgi:hypothetical protein